MTDHTDRTRPSEIRRTERGHDFYPPTTALAAIPRLYATDSTPGEHKTIHAHYFASWGDWYIAEYDPADGEAFGWACIGGDHTMGEWGYIDLPALESHRSARGLPHLVERDLNFEPTVAARCLPKGRQAQRCEDSGCQVCRPEPTATLIVGLFDSSCSHCGEQSLVYGVTHHAEVSGYGPDAPGCGARFVDITRGHPAVALERLREMRPDLPVRGETA